MHRFIATGMALLLLAATAEAAPTPAQKCATAKHKAAFKRATAEGKCYQKAFVAGVAVDPACLQAAASKFTVAIGKAEDKGGCVRTGDVADIGAAVETCVNSISALTPTNVPTCELDASCTAGHDCVSLTDNSAAATFALRVAQLTVAAPAALSTGPLASTIASGVELNNANACNLSGTGTFNWLLEMNTAGATARTGGALPMADPSLGYSFASGITLGSMVAPQTVSLHLAGDGTFTTGSGNVTLPVYMDPSGTQGFALPLRGARFSGQLSADRNCIGNYNAAGLVPPDCLADSMHPTFVDGASVHASINLEDADAVNIAVLNMSLCVLLSGNPGAWGDGGSPMHCKRDMGAIVFAGDWCSVTDSAGGCADSLELSATFAASSVVVH